MGDGREREGAGPAPTELRLGTLLQLEAEQAGRGADWRAYVAGRLLLPPGVHPSFGLLAEPVPGDRAAADAVAARWRVDPDVLWLVIQSALPRLRPGTRPGDHARQSPGAAVDSG